MKSTYKIKKENLKLTTLGFTLIELIAVLVILAILALIVTPLVMNIIRKAKISADKRSIDAYGRSVELAIANYLLDNGDFPSDISQLTVEYTGDEVVCSTAQLNSDSSVYLANCTVGGRSVDYAYGSNKNSPSPTYVAYSVGDEVRYNNIDYYVINDSDESESTVTLLKAVPLLASDVNTYEVLLNMTSAVSSGSGTGATIYSSSNNSEYSTSYVKRIVDAWINDNANETDLVIDSTGYSARLITLDELIDNLGYTLNAEATGYRISSENTPDWVYGDYSYWTMSAKDSNQVWSVLSQDYSGAISAGNLRLTDYGAVRPVITISKSALSA